MKAVYTIIDDTLYKMDQPSYIPYHVVRTTENHSSLTYDESNKKVRVQLWLDFFNNKNVKTNKAMYQEMISALKYHLITQIDTIQNFYRMTIDYSLFTKNGKELEHSITVQNIKPVDAMVPLGIAKNNELVYRFVKKFEKQLEFRFKDGLPYGIMRQPHDKFILKINNINIYQDTNTIEERHKSMEERPFKYGSHTVESSLEYTRLVFSSKEQGIEYTPIELNYIPRLIEFGVEILLDNFIVVYDDNEVSKILQENIWIKNGKDDGLDPDPGDECPPCKPPKDPNWDVDDGNDPPCPCPPVEEPPKPNCPCKPSPDINGRGYYYERTTFEKPGALLVVEDKYPESIFNSSCMVKKGEVIVDIPNITIGDYVKKVL